MNKFIYLTISLLIPSEVYSYNCPKPTDTCRSGYSSFSFSDPKAPQCWSEGYNGWQCTAKQGGSCNEYNGQIDIGKCKQPIPECPKATDSCLVGDIAYLAFQSFAPKCWAKNPSATFGWTCQGSSSTKCDASKGEVDLTTCKIPPPIPVPECPKATDTCKSGDIIWNANDPKAPKCWSKTTSSWTCQGNSNTKCDASKGELDLTTCKIPPPIPVPECPKATDTCKSGDIIWNANDPKAPKCWSKSSTSQYGWICQGNSNTKCDASKGELDLTTCKIPPPIPVPECPKATDSCLVGDIAYLAFQPFAPKCWSKTTSGWTCQGDSNTKCDASKGELDLTTCKIPPPIPVPECPKATDTCQSGTSNFKANDPKAPKCWSKTTSGWTCQGNSNTKCDASKGELDLTTCKIPPPTPKCPTKDDYCRYGYSYFYATDSKAPACWTRSSYGWTCTNKNGSSCSDNQVDISTCFPKPTPPKCPGSSDKCYDNYGRSYTLKGYGTPRCWRKSNYGWSCRNSYSGCTSSEVDIKSC